MEAVAADGGHHQGPRVQASPMEAEPTLAHAHDTRGIEDVDQEELDQAMKEHGLKKWIRMDKAVERDKATRPGPEWSQVKVRITLSPNGKIISVEYVDDLPGQRRLPGTDGGNGRWSRVQHACVKRGAKAIIYGWQRLG